MIKNKNYQDLVIKNGKFIGKFNDLYQNFNDPWLSMEKNGKYIRWQDFQINTKNTLATGDVF